MSKVFFSSFDIWYCRSTPIPFGKSLSPKCRTVARNGPRAGRLGEERWDLWNWLTCRITQKSLTLIFPVLLDTRTAQQFTSVFFSGHVDIAHISAKSSADISAYDWWLSLLPFPTPMTTPHAGRRIGKTPSLQYVLLVKRKRAKYTPQIINSTFAESCGATPSK